MSQEGKQTEVTTCCFKFKKEYIYKKYLKNELSHTITLQRAII